MAKWKKKKDFVRGRVACHIYPFSYKRVQINASKLFLFLCKFYHYANEITQIILISKVVRTTPRPRYYLLPSSHSSKSLLILGDGRYSVIGSPLRIAERHTHCISPDRAYVSLLSDTPLLPKYLEISGFGLTFCMNARTWRLLKWLVARALDATQQRKPLSLMYFSKSLGLLLFSPSVRLRINLYPLGAISLRLSLVSAPTRFCSFVANRKCRKMAGSGVQPYTPHHLPLSPVKPETS